MLYLHNFNFPQSWTLQLFPSVGASVSPIECAALSRLINAKRSFEFGTSKGVSTTQLAVNAVERGIVFTLDLPEDHFAYSLPVSKLAEHQIAAEGGKGILIPRDLLGRLTFLSSDSATFDESPYLGTMDLVFVDAAHSYDYVKNDTTKGREILRTGGASASQDCSPHHRDVVKYINECDFDAKLVSGTELAYAINHN